MYPQNKNPYSTVDNDTIGQMYTFALKDGFVVDGRPGFVFSPTMRFMFVAAPVINLNRMFQSKEKYFSAVPMR